MSNRSSEQNTDSLPALPSAADLTTNTLPAYYVGPEVGSRVVLGSEIEGSGKSVGSGLVVPRQYQLDCESAVELQWSLGVPSTLAVVATGLGKTVIAANIIARRLRGGARVLFLAHRTELLEQTLAKLAAVGVSGVLEKASSYASLTDRVVVASVQSLGSKRLTRFPVDHFDLIVVDEAHHAVAFLYQQILARFPRAKVLGLTATPMRADGRSLGKIFHSVAYRKDLRQGIAEGWLCPLRVRRVWLDALDLREVKKKGGDFDPAHLDRICTDPPIVQAMGASLMELSHDRKTIVFCASVAHAFRLETILRRFGCSAVALHGGDDALHRANVLRDFERGRIQYLLNCSLFVEGFDAPSIECVAIARPTLSLALYMQMIGRGTRLFEGKRDCLALDFQGASRLGLVSPIDVLASGSPVLDQLRDEIEPLMLRGEVELSKRLDEYEQKAEARLTREELLVTAAFRSREIDPFLGKYMPHSGPLAGAPIDERVRRALYDVLGISHPPAGLSMNEAMQWLEGARLRRNAGLCTVKQARKLSTYNLDSSRMTADRAMALFAQLASHGWSPLSVRFEPEYRG